MEKESIRVTSTYISTSILNGSNLLVGVQKHCHNTHKKTLSLKNSCAKTVAASVLQSGQAASLDFLHVKQRTNERKKLKPNGSKTVLTPTPHLSPAT